MNSDEHIIGGLVAGAISEIINQKDLEVKNPQKVLVASLFAGIGGILPDLLEPATNPNHRNFFHSISFGAALFMANEKIKNNSQINGDLKFLVDNLVAGSLVHLGLDSTTPRSLPLI